MPSDLQVSNIKDLTGSNTGLSIASDGQVTIAQNNPTITLGSNATFPTKSLLNLNSALVNAGDSTEYSSLTTVSASEFTPTITSGNDVIIWISYVYQKRSGGTSAFADIYLQGGGLGAGSSGKKISAATGYNATDNIRFGFTATVIDTNPGSTTPTYSLYYGHVSGSARIVSIYAVWGEIKG